MSFPVNSEPYGGERHMQEYGKEEKIETDYIDQAEVANADRPNRRLEAPPLVRDMTPEQRIHTEKALVRKIDGRLLPAIIIMYIMNYLGKI